MILYFFYWIILSDVLEHRFDYETQIIIFLLSRILDIDFLIENNLRKPIPASGKGSTSLNLAPLLEPVLSNRRNILKSLEIF